MNSWFYRDGKNALLLLYRVAEPRSKALARVNNSFFLWFNSKTMDLSFYINSRLHLAISFHLVHSVLINIDDNDNGSDMSRKWAYF